MTEKPTFEIDGARFSDKKQFFAEITHALQLTSWWGRNLDAFNDILRGGFGTPEGGFILVWRNSERSKQKLGMPLFNTIIEIIQTHGAGGDEENDGVELVLA